MTDNWLAEELRAAVDEVASWPPGMRRGIDVEPMRKAMDRITDAQGGTMTRPETYRELVEVRATTLMTAQRGRPSAIFHMAQTKHSKVCGAAKRSCGLCLANKYREMARATLEAERAVGIVPAPLEATWYATQKARGKFAGKVRPMPSHQLVEDAINAAIAATPYQEDVK